MNNFLRVSIVASACLITTLAATVGRADAQDDALSNALSTCQSCHGLAGDSTVSTTPRLNGQQAAYLAARFQSFSDPTIQTPHATATMWPITSQVADRIIPELAKYFAAQVPTQPQPSGPLIAEGKAIYQDGAKDIPSCQSCHGKSAEGAGSVPRLAGQHADYLRAQLETLNLQLRVSNVMHPNAKYMSQHQIDAVAAYLANG